MNIEFDDDPVYGENDKYIKTKIKLYVENKYKFSRQKNAKRRCIIQVFVIDNVRFCYLSK